MYILVGWLTERMLNDACVTVSHVCISHVVISLSFVFPLAPKKKKKKKSYFCNYLVGPAAFRPRAHTAATYTPLVEKGRPVLQGLLAIDFLAKEAS